jgi:type IV secretion system protein VirD4
MTAKTTTEQPPRQRTKAEKAAIRWLLIFAALEAPALVLCSLPLAVLGILILLAFAAVRVRKAHRRWRQGGKSAARQRAKFQGWASRRDITRLRWAHGTLTRRLCPGAGLLDLGRAPFKGPVAVCRENSALLVGPPGYGKSGAMACYAADAPGLLFCTSTKTELLLDTLPYRDGPFWVLNADGYGGIPSTLAWSPVEGCGNPATAMRRAGDLMAASPRDPSGKDAYHEDRAAKLLRFALHAAAVTGASMHQVAAWVRNPLSERLTTILQSPLACPGWDRQFAELLVGGRDGDWITGLIASASAALGWMDDPVMAAAASPFPGEGFSARGFARGHGSVYLIGKKRPHGSLAPYFAALGAEIFEQVKVCAMETASGRMPVPATFVLDEMPLTCPLPLHDILAEARGPLATWILAAQTLAQLRAKFGKEDGDTIRSACPVEVFFGGEKRADDLADVSRVIGDVDTWHHPGDPAGASCRPLMPPAALHRMKKGRAVILLPECKPVIARMPAIWERRGHIRADLAAVTARMHLGQAPQLAIEAPRPPIVLPAPPHPASIPGHLRRPVTQAAPVPSIPAADKEPACHPAVRA